MSDTSADRRFGLLISSVLVAMACHAAFRQRASAGWAMAGAALLLLVVTLLRPHLLALPRRVWMRFGELLGAVVSPIVLGVLYFVLLTPVGLLARLRGRDELRLKRPSSGSLWRHREPAGPSPESLKHQF